MRPRIAAVIPNWNGAALLGQALEGLARQTRPPDRIVVVDDASTDTSVELARARGVEVITLDRNRGFAPTVNRGLEAVSDDRVVILNNDVELEPDWLERLESSIGASSFAVGRMLNASDHSSVDGSFDLLCRGACAWRAGSGRRDAELWRRARTVSFPPFTAALFRRDIFDQVGYLDESFDSYLEDVDFGVRCASLGHSGIYVPDAVAYHRGSATLGRWSARTVRNISRNQLLLVAKHYSLEMLFVYGWPIAAAHLLWGLVAVRHGQGIAWLSGKYEAVRRFRSARRNVNHETVVKLRQVLEASERELFALQSEGGFDWYWRLYFALT